MCVRINARMSKIMPTVIKVGVRTYATYANCRTLHMLNVGNTLFSVINKHFP